MSSPEYDMVVAPTLRWLGALPGCKAINVHGSIFSERGTPDIIGSFRGRAFAIEAKRPGGGKVAPLQSVRLRQWAAAGAVVAVVRSLSEVKRLWEREFGYSEYGQE